MTVVTVFMRYKTKSSHSKFNHFGRRLNVDTLVIYIINWTQWTKKIWKKRRTTQKQNVDMNCERKWAMEGQVDALLDWTHWFSKVAKYCTTFRIMAAFNQNKLHQFPFNWRIMGRQFLFGHMQTYLESSKYGTITLIVCASVQSPKIPY